MGLPTVLFLIFLVLKLTHEITWPWLYVFLPLIVEVGIDIIALGVVGLVAASGVKRLNRLTR